MLTSTTPSLKPSASTNPSLKLSAVPSGCISTPTYNCCGSGIYESGEGYTSCPADCDVYLWPAGSTSECHEVTSVPQDDCWVYRLMIGTINHAGVFYGTMVVGPIISTPILTHQLLNVLLTIEVIQSVQFLHQVVHLRLLLRQQSLLVIFIYGHLEL